MVVLFALSAFPRVVSEPCFQSVKSATEVLQKLTSVYLYKYVSHEAKKTLPLFHPILLVDSQGLTITKPRRKPHPTTPSSGRDSSFMKLESLSQRAIEAPYVYEPNIQVFLYCPIK